MLYNIAYFKMKKAFIYKLLKLSKDSLKDLSKQRTLAYIHGMWEKSKYHSDENSLPPPLVLYIFNTMSVKTHIQLPFVLP